jgi:hypothetical protein
VVAALRNNAAVVGLGRMDQRTSEEMTVEQARRYIEDLGGPAVQSFDWIWGRAVKIGIRGDSLDEGLYDRDYGPGAAARVIDHLRETGFAGTIPAAETPRNLPAPPRTAPGRDAGAPEEDGAEKGTPGPGNRMVSTDYDRRVQEDAAGIQCDDSGLLWYENRARSVPGATCAACEYPATGHFRVWSAAGDVRVDADMCGGCGGNAIVAEWSARRGEPLGHGTAPEHGRVDGRPRDLGYGTGGRNTPADAYRPGPDGAARSPGLDFPQASPFAASPFHHGAPSGHVSPACPAPGSAPRAPHR